MILLKQKIFNLLIFFTSIYHSWCFCGHHLSINVSELPCSCKCLLTRGLKQDAFTHHFHQRIFWFLKSIRSSYYASITLFQRVFRLTAATTPVTSSITLKSSSIWSPWPSLEYTSHKLINKHKLDEWSWNSNHQQHHNLIIIVIIVLIIIQHKLQYTASVLHQNC